MGKQGKRFKLPKKPFVSICTPTYNRRPFIPSIIKCIEKQDYPKEKIEWIIIDDGTDKIEDLVSHLPYVKYFKFDKKMTLGKKRNISHEKSKGDIIVYMDDDDYYPPERVSHAVETLVKNPKALCSGSSKMYMYFNDVKEMYTFGPYGPNHATAGTFAFKKTLLDKTHYKNEACLAEEKTFLKDYTVPFVQLASEKTILVFAHSQNTFDKRKLLENPNSKFVQKVDVKPCDIIKDEELLHFYTEELEEVLNNYKKGNIKNKPDVIKQTNEIYERRNKMREEQIQKMKDKDEVQRLIGIITSNMNI